MIEAASGLRVVVVDDDEDQRYVLRRRFAQAGVEDVREAVDGADALVVIEREQPDLVVLDLAMPVRSGFDVLPELRQVAPHATVVVVSNLSRRRWEATILELGAVAFVEKRTPSQDLVREILTAATLLDQLARRLTTRLPSERGAPREARQFVRGALAEIDPELVDAVELLVSELVTNAVVHASSAPRLEVALLPDKVRVEVHDDDATLPVRRIPDEERPGGRGLLLLDGVASAWGVEPLGHGKVVWFEVARTA